MKQFLSISSNQITQFIPEKDYFELMSEIIFSYVETKYSLIKNEEGKNQIVQYPETETFRFYASAEALTLIRDRMNEEIEHLKMLSKKHKAQ